jgi:hypothetical protein
MIWQPIDQIDKKIPKGYIRIYTFTPEIREGREYANLSRAYNISKHMGHRVCDGFMDIPMFPEKSTLQS